MSLSWRNYPSDGTGRVSTIGTDSRKAVMDAKTWADQLHSLAEKIAKGEVSVAEWAIYRPVEAVPLLAHETAARWARTGETTYTIKVVEKINGPA